MLDRFLTEDTEIMQKVRPTTIQDLLKAFDHPSSALFRAIELRQIYEGCKGIEFKTPSLDIGSGDGKIAEILFDNKFTYGVDNGEANDYQIAIDKNRYGKVLLESAEKMSLPAKSVKFVFSNSVLEHIPDIDAVLRETSRVLVDGGYFVFTTPTKYFKKYISLSKILDVIGLNIINRLYSDFRNKALNHYHLHEHQFYTEKLPQYGLKVVNYSYAVSEETLKAWDLMALKIKLFKLLGVNIETKLKEQETARITNLYNKDKVNKLEGANLLIISQKVA